MPYKNQYIAQKLECWFAQTYELGNALKHFLRHEKITSSTVLTVDQAITLLKHINGLYEHQLKMLSACHYVRMHPLEFSAETHKTNLAIDKALNTLMQLLEGDLEAKARKILKDYLAHRQIMSRTLGFQSAVKIDSVPTKDDIIAALVQSQTQELDARYLARVHWKLAISDVVRKNHIKQQRWNDYYTNVQDYYLQVNEEVKDQVDRLAKNHYDGVLKQHESFMKWLELFEEAIRQAEKNVSLLFDNLDGVANRKAKIIQMMIRASLSAALSPLLLNNFIDPTLTIFNEVIMKLHLSKGEIDLNLSQSETLYQMTGFLPDPNSRSYRDAYAKLAQEGIYEQIDRYKKYLKHKIDALSEASELRDMMSKNSKVWEHYSPDQIIHAQKMKLIADAQYENPETKLKQPEHFNTLTSALVKPFETLIEQAFKPIEMQYGNQKNLEQLHEFIDKITFDDNRAGPDSHNQYQNNSLVKMLSGHVELYYIVGYLVENSTFFGMQSRNKQLYAQHFKADSQDKAFGLAHDDASTTALIVALLKRLIKLEAGPLKTLLELDITDLSEKKIIQGHALMAITAGDSTQYRFAQGLKSCFLGSGYEPTPQHLKRQQMLGAIIAEYYNRDLSELLQRKIADFAQAQGITLHQQADKPGEISTVLTPKWLSEKDIEKHVKALVKPFVEQVESHEGQLRQVKSLSLNYYQNNSMCSQAATVRAIEQTQDNLAKKNRPVAFKY